MSQHVLGRSVALAVAGTMAAGLALTAGLQSANAAPAPTSQATGRFLSGVLGGTNLDTVASIAGEAVQSTGGKSVTKWNSLSVSALDNAITLPLTGALQLPGGNVVTLGAVQQYAQANSDGSAHGASGAVSNSGGISGGGQNGAPPANATIDLAGFGGAAITKTLGDVKLSTGALAATADQAKGGTGAQTGKYQIAGLALDLSAPGLAALIKPLITEGTATLAQFATAFNSLKLPITVTGVSDIPQAADALTSVSADNGAVTASLTDGTVHVDLAKLLAANGLDINHLPANTHLLPYLAKAFSTALPQAISSVIGTLETKITTAFGNIGFNLGGVPLNAAQLKQATAILDQLRTTLTSALSAGAAQLGSAVFTPLATASEQLLDPVVNVQSTDGGTFTERALQLRLGGSAVTLNLASASVGPSTIAAVAPAPTTAAPVAPVTSQVKGVSAIKIDAGRAAVSHPGLSPWGGAGVALLLVGLTGLVWRGTRRVRRG